MKRPSIGIWLVGAKGGVAATVCVGLAALKQQRIAPVGVVSALPQFASLKLADWPQFVVGGHDVREASLLDEALRMHSQSRAIDERLILDCKQELDEINGRIRPGTLLNVGQMIQSLSSPSLAQLEETPRQAIERIQNDLKQFVEQHQLERLVMVNVASTEPAPPEAKLPQSWAELEPTLDRVDCPLPASSLYAIAALDLGHVYINFTPSLGSTPAAICELAEARGTCHMGRDGKTGETLLKSTLAPMFADRNLHVMSWVGHNIFGNMDGKVLEDPANKAAKVTSKDRLLSKIFGYTPQTHVSIEYIESLGDWKTAWDHVHFQGFLGTPMTLQFIWQGCDSLLAAPLVIDLVRFAERARRAGQRGLLTFLASFFKSPLGTDQHDFVRQFQLLEAWTEQTA